MSLSKGENKKDLWDVRPATPEDIPFIYSSWLKSFKHDSQLGKSMRSSVFFENYREIIDSILSRSEVMIACLAEDPFVILGYLVFSDRVVHYAFVKEVFRGKGILTTLTNNIPTFLSYTHKTFSLQEHKLTSMQYNPLLLYRGV